MSTTTDGVGLANSLYAKNTKRLIKLIGDIRALGGQGLLELPRIAVIGNQSAGKSSLIEAISGITVPRAQGTCTRCPMECRLQQQPNSIWHCQVRLRFETDSNGKPLHHIQETPFGGVVNSTSELEERLRLAQLAILNPGVNSDALLAQGKIPPDFDARRALPFSSNVVCVDVWGPDVPDLSFIDLPGIIQNETEAGSMDGIKSMVRKHVQGPCIILLTITMRDDIENQNAAQVAKEADPTGVRTIGVLTKADTILDGEETRWRNILEGREHNLALGYFITKQPGPKDTLSHQLARKAEAEFFSAHPTWSTCSSSTQARMGTGQLGLKLSSLLSSLIDRTLPKLREDVRGLRAKLGKQLSLLPDRLTEPPILHMMKLVGNVSDRLALLVQGDARHREMIQACNPAFRSFQRDVRATAPRFVATTREEARLKKKRLSEQPPGAPVTPTAESEPGSEGDPISVLESGTDDSDDSDDEPSFPSAAINRGKKRKRPVKHDHSKSIYLDELSQLVEEHITRELPYNVPYGAKADLIVRSVVDWERLSFRCADAIIDVCKAEALSTTDSVFENYKYGSLDKASRAVIENEVATLSRELKERLQWQIEMEKVPYTQNRHYLSDYRDKFLSRYKSQRPRTKAADKVKVAEALALLRSAGIKINNVEDLSRVGDADVYEQELIIAAEVRAYFQVAYKRVIDNIPRIIDHDFVRRLRPRIQKALEVKFFTDEKSAARYLTEDPDISIHRDDLEAKSRRLTEIDPKLESLNSGEAI